MMEHYKYQPLERDAIRLLEAAAGEGTEPLRCRIVHRPLSNDLQFDAISFCWGIPTSDHILHTTRDAAESNQAPSSSFRKMFKKKPVRAGDVHIKIKSSLHSALTRIDNSEKLSIDPSGRTPWALVC